MSEITVKTNSSDYTILIESEDIKSFAGKFLPKKCRYLAVISEKVEKLYGKYLDIPKSNKFILKDGEKEKNFKNYQRILDRAFELKLTRKDFLIAIGGGVVGDLTGFAAATYMRGIGLIQVPTDSSVGGKTAINNKFGKNLIGAFYQPKAVYINSKFLNTLDERQFKSGLGEVLKYAFIEKNCFSDSDFISFLFQNREKILKKDDAILLKIIEICVNMKKNVVERDEKESDLRRVLNFGHTQAHAIERITDFKKFTHGEAVVEGMRIMFDFALKKGLINADYKNLTADLIASFGYKSLPQFNREKIIKLVKSDKKADAKTVGFVLPTGYSQVGIFDMKPEDVF